MKNTRRGFLKFAGLSAVGVAGSTAVATRTRASQEHEPPATEGKRLALVVDLRKFAKNDELLDKITDACHRAHNVPDFSDDPKNEVKWIWSEVNLRYSMFDPDFKLKLDHMHEITANFVH